MIKISRTKAKQLYEQGVTVCVIPCNINQGSDRFDSFLSCLEKDYKFENIVAYYRRMNCNERDGKTLDFYWDKAIESECVK